MVGEDPERQPELKALVHTYSAIYGDGKIWEGATPLHQQLLTMKLDVISGPKTAKSAGDDEEMVEAKGTIAARYIRIVLPGLQEKGLKLGEIEVMQAGYNIAKRGKPSMSGALKESPATNAIDGKKKAKPHAATKPGKDSWFELDLGKVETIESIVIWPFFTGTNAKNLKPSKALNNFDVILLDGDRKEVFAARKQPAPNPKHMIDLTAAADDAPEPAPEPKAKEKPAPKK